MTPPADPVIRNAALAGVVVAVGATPFLPAGVPVLLALAGLGVVLVRPGQGGAAADAGGTDGGSTGEIGGTRAEAR